jgi:hypothetical protein
VLNGSFAYNPAYPKTGTFYFALHTELITLL